MLQQGNVDEQTRAQTGSSWRIPVEVCTVAMALAIFPVTRVLVSSGDE